MQPSITTVTDKWHDTSVLLYRACRFTYYEDSDALAVLPALGAVSFLIGAIATGMAVCNWQNSGAPDTTVVQKGPIQVSLRQSMVVFAGDRVVCR